MAIHDVTETLEIQNTSLRSLKQKKTVGGWEPISFSRALKQERENERRPRSVKFS